MFNFFNIFIVSFLFSIIFIYNPMWLLFYFFIVTLFVSFLLFFVDLWFIGAVFLLIYPGGIVLLYTLSYSFFNVSYYKRVESLVWKQYLFQLLFFFNIFAMFLFKIMNYYGDNSSIFAFYSNRFFKVSYNVKTIYVNKTDLDLLSNIVFSSDYYLFILIISLLLYVAVIGIISVFEIANIGYLSIMVANCSWISSIEVFFLVLLIFLPFLFSVVNYYILETYSLWAFWWYFINYLLSNNYLENDLLLYKFLLWGLWFVYLFVIKKIDIFSYLFINYSFIFLICIICTKFIFLGFMFLEMFSICLFFVIVRCINNYYLGGLLKYSVLNVLSSVFLVISVSEIFEFSQKVTTSDNKSSVFFSILFILSFIIKLGLFPFHYVYLDIIEAMPIVLVAYVLNISKLITFVFFSRYIISGYVSVDKKLTWALFLVSIISYLSANFFNVFVKKYLDFFFFSSLSHFSFCVMFYNYCYYVVMYYIVLYITISFFSVFVFTMFENFNNKSLNFINNNFSIIGENKMIFTILIFTLSNLPPFPLFWFKMFILFVVFGLGLKIVVCLILLVNLIISYIYVVRVGLIFFK